MMNSIHVFFLIFFHILPLLFLTYYETCLYTRLFRRKKNRADGKARPMSVFFKDFPFQAHIITYGKRYTQTNQSKCRRNPLGCYLFPDQVRGKSAIKKKKRISIYHPMAFKMNISKKMITEHSYF